MKSLNERKPIQPDINKVAAMRKKYGAVDDKAELDAAFAELKSKAKNVYGDSLSDWDREGLKIATKYVRDENRDEFRRSIYRILELAGLSPEMEQQIYKQQQIELKKMNIKNN